ncbi:zinc finger BED domain-containing protein RICESLEEPER 2 [Tanacetum coccineum]
MDQQNTPYESISSSMPTYESFSSQQNITIEDETIDVETLGSEDKKRKRKAQKKENATIKSKENRNPVAHLWFGEVLDIDKHLREWQANASFKDMIVEMRKKYDKYWGDYKKINHYMYFAVILDPTMKSENNWLLGLKHLIEMVFVCQWCKDEEVRIETPFQFFKSPDDLCANLVEKVEKDWIMFSIYKEKIWHKATHSGLTPRSSLVNSTAQDSSWAMLS